MNRFQRRIIKGVIGVVTCPRLTLAVCAVLLVAAVSLAWFHMTLSTDQDELMTPNVKFFRDYIEFTNRFPENDSFVVIIEPKDYAHPPVARRWRDLADRLTARLKQVQPYVKRVDARVPLDKLGRQGSLFDSWEAVKANSDQMREFMQLIKVVAEPPGLEGVLLGDNPTQRFFSASGADPRTKDLAAVLTRSLQAALAAPPEQWRRGREIPDLTDADPDARFSPEPYGYNMVPDENKRHDPAHAGEKILVVNVFTDTDYTSLADVTEPLKQIRSAVDEVAGDFPEFKHPGVTGRPALEADEMATSDRDTTIAEICGLSLVFLRNLWLAIVAEVCLGVGIGWTFGWATLVIGRLNLLSLVFVIALTGIGMDYLIQVLTRYRFEKKRYVRPQAIWVRVFRYVSPPVSTACLGAAGAFLVAALTDFRGAGELGIIAGGGLLLCLVSGYTLLPALLTLFPASVGAVDESRRYRHRDPLPAAGGWRLLAPGAWIAVAAVGLVLALPPRFDPNLLKLQADGLESVRLVRKLRTWYAVVMCDDLDQLRRAGAALTPQSEEASTIASLDSLQVAMDKQRWLQEHNQDLRDVKWYDPPAPNPTQLNAIAGAAEALTAAWKDRIDPGERAALTQDVQSLTRTLRDPAQREACLARLAVWQKALIREMRSSLEMFTPPSLDIDALPPELRDHYVSYRDAAGRMTDPPRPTYALYIYPKADLWDHGRLEEFVRELERRFPAGSPDGTLTGIAPQLFHSTEAIYGAFLKSTGYALVLIFLLVLLDFRKLSQTLLAISVLAMGLPMLLLVMWLWRYFGDPLSIPGTWNFANFFALPILIGAGHEYGVFMVHRYKETLDDPRRVWRTWDVSDRALLLCAIVTSSSFGFLMGARHHGLASLGWVMAVGSACIYLATLLVLRPILQWRIKHKRVYDRNGVGREVAASSH